MNRDNAALEEELVYLRTLMAEDYKGRLILYGTLDIVYLIIVAVYVSKEGKVSPLVGFFIFLFLLLTSACWTYYKKYRLLSKSKEAKLGGSEKPYFDSSNLLDAARYMAGPKKLEFREHEYVGKFRPSDGLFERKDK